MALNYIIIYNLIIQFKGVIYNLKQSIEIMKNSIVSILQDNIKSIYLFGSVPMDDFKLGWSDIDILCLTPTIITDEQAQKLVMLRQSLLMGNKDNVYFRSFEGAIVSLDEFITNEYTKVVYWGTSGQRITDNYFFDAFSQYELIKDGILLYGDDIRSKFILPSYCQLRDEVIRHYEVIRKYAVNTDKSLYSCGWLLDIARGIYTLQTGSVISKTKAGEWALEQNICPIEIESELIKTLEIRNNPLKHKNNEDVQTWLTTLGHAIQLFADVLEEEIEQTK